VDPTGRRRFLPYTEGSSENLVKTRGGPVVPAPSKRVFRAPVPGSQETAFRRRPVRTPPAPAQADQVGPPCCCPPGPAPPPIAPRRSRRMLLWASAHWGSAPASNAAAPCLLEPRARAQKAGHVAANPAGLRCGAGPWHVFRSPIFPLLSAWSSLSPCPLHVFSTSRLFRLPEKKKTVRRAPLVFVPLAVSSPLPPPPKLSRGSPGRAKSPPTELRFFRRLYRLSSHFLYSFPLHSLPSSVLAPHPPLSYFFPPPHSLPMSLAPFGLPPRCRTLCLWASSYDLRLTGADETEHPESPTPNRPLTPPLRLSFPGPRPNEAPIPAGIPSTGRFLGPKLLRLSLSTLAASPSNL